MFEQVYPEYAIIYRRQYDKSKAPVLGSSSTIVCYQMAMIRAGSGQGLWGVGVGIHAGVP